MIYPYGKFNIIPLIRDIKTVERSRGNPSIRDAKWKYKDIVCAFDIETSRIKTGEHKGTKRIKTGEHKGTNKKIIEDFISIMYIWQFQIGEDITIIGRTWEQFNSLIDDLTKALTNKERLMIFVHNLSYEFSFLKDKKILGKKLDERSVFCVKPRTVLSFLCCDNKLEFRCSYIHSNMSLDEFTNKMQVKHTKLSGDEFDYSKYRDSDTVLTDRELEYCVNDVIGLVEAINKELEVDGDTLYTIPKTSTGYVRRDIKKALREVPYRFMQKQLPSFEDFMILREAFRGGNTHANRYYSNIRVDGVINSMDISSSYPNTQINCKFPISQFYDVTEDVMNIDGVINMLKHDKAVLMRIAIYNLDLIDEFEPVPYISRDKCRNIVNALYDNGRIIKADYLETTITDIDLSIILDMYNGKIEVLCCKFANYGYLPQCMRDVILEYFRRKTELKGVDGQEIYYMKSKNKLNSVYGMTCQNPMNVQDCFINGEFIQGAFIGDKFKSVEQYGIDLYREVYEKAKPILPYQWGVWCTCWARKRLQDGINIVGKERFLYCDTDSIYYVGECDIEKYNKQRIKDSKKNGAFATDKKGVTHYMGVFEKDDKSYKSFITMGAKKYAYIDDKDKLHITIAGVNKRKGVDELNEFAKEHRLKDGLDALREDFTFYNAGGTEAVYNDEPIEEYTYNGKTFYVPTNVVIKDSTYTIGLSNDYLKLLDSIIELGLSDLFFRNKNNLPIESLEFY